MFFLFAFPFHFFFKCLTPRIEAVILHGPSLYVLQIMHHPLSPLSHPNASWYFDVKQRMVKSLSQYQTPILGVGNIVYIVDNFRHLYTVPRLILPKSLLVVRFLDCLLYISILKSKVMANEPKNDTLENLKIGHKPNG